MQTVLKIVLQTMEESIRTLRNMYLKSDRDNSSLLYEILFRAGHALFLGPSRSRAEPFVLALLRSFLGLNFALFSFLHAPLLGFFHAHISALLVSFRAPGSFRARESILGLIRNGVFNFPRNTIIASCWM
jgi:hypothetical protein